MAKVMRPWTLVVTSLLLYPGCNRNQSGDEIQPRTEAAREPVAAPGATDAGTTLEAARAQTDAGQPLQADAGASAEAKVDLKAAEGVEIDGDAELEETAGGVRIVVEIDLDKGPSTHGIHVHEKGDCSNIKGKSMGEHFAPYAHDHALPSEATPRHLGDLGNIEVGKDGKGKLEISVPGANLKPGDSKSFLGKALVIHQKKDTGKAKQPSGDSGDPIACGVIEAD